MKEVIATDKAPQAIGPYSQGIKLSDLVFTSGQLPIDPKTGSMPETIEAQTEQSLLNVQAILQSQGLGLGDVVKTTVFLQDMNDFAKMNEVYARMFDGAKGFPARSAVQVARLPKDALIEIEAIASR